MTQDPAPPLLDAVRARLALPPGRALCLDATPAVATVAIQAGHTPVAIQTWRPLHDALHAAGIDSRPVADPDDLGFDLALVRLDAAGCATWPRWPKASTVWPGMAS